MRNSTKAVIARTALLIILMVVFVVASMPSANALQYFKLSEFTDRAPPHESKMNHDFLLKLDELRHRVGFPLYINSGYRSPDHPDEVKKTKPGTHNKGIAVDIKAIDPVKRRLILRHAKALGFTGIGIYPLHIHLDARKTKQVIWVGKYKVNQARDSPRR